MDIYFSIRNSAKDYYFVDCVVTENISLRNVYDTTDLAIYGAFSVPVRIITLLDKNKKIPHDPNMISILFAEFYY